MLHKILVFIIFLFCFTTGFAQDTIPPVQEIDTVIVDTTIVGTTVIRTDQLKIKYIPRGVQLTNPYVSFNKTKTRTKEIKRFRVPSFWERVNKLGINFNEVAFVNWKAGGSNSVSALGNMKFARNYKFRYVQWNNNLELRYGLSAIDGQKLRKADDALRFTSTFAYRRDTISDWYYSASADFRTQFSNGYKYPNRNNAISRFMAPGYALLGAGTSYIPEGKKFNLRFAPLTLKATFVLDQELANRGAFGVKKAVLNPDGSILKEGENSLMQFGFLITNTWNTVVYKNMNLNNRISLYTDYIASFGNIDLNWELRLDLKVNQYVKANIGTHVLFDDDIIFDEVRAPDGTITTPGRPKVQFKQLLGVGLTYDF